MATSSLTLPVKPPQLTLTKNFFWFQLIREKGTMLGKIVIEGEKEESVPFLNSNLVNEVSTKVNEKLNQTIKKG